MAKFPSSRFRRDRHFAENRQQSFSPNQIRSASTRMPSGRRLIVSTHGVDPLIGGAIEFHESALGEFRMFVSGKSLGLSFPPELSEPRP